MARKAAGRKTAGSARKGAGKGQKRTAGGSRAAKAAAARGRARKKTPAARGRKKAAPRKKASAPKGRARTQAKGRTTARKTAGRKTSSRRAAPAASRASAKSGAKKKTAARKRTAAKRPGGTGRERELAQTPETGRTVSGPTNPFPTKRSTGTAAGAGGTRQAPGLERARRHLREVDETVPSPPSTLDPERRQPSAARTGREEMREARRNHTEVSPEITAGDVDADWAGAYDVGDEAPGGDNPTPDQDRVDDIGKAVGVEYEDNEELKGSDKIAERDKNRWELDPASSDDYQDRD
jgi:hypothetical protein